MEVNGQLHNPAALPHGKEFLVLTRYETGWFPWPIWTLWSGESLLALLGIEP
jgi:hypothetical protein